MSFLNSKGGVIFIGCRKGEDEERVPLLEETTEGQKEAIESKLQSYITSIFPTVALNRHIDFSFLPVGVCCQQESSNWLKGVYILRITVLPTQP